MATVRAIFSHHGGQYVPASDRPALLSGASFLIADTVAEDVLTRKLALSGTIHVSNVFREFDKRSVMCYVLCVRLPFVAYALGQQTLLRVRRKAAGRQRPLDCIPLP